MTKNEAQMDMPDEYLKEIGRILVCWNSLEHLLDAALIAALSGKPQDSDGRASAILAQMGVDQKISALEAILRLIDKNPNGLGNVFRDNIKPTLAQSKEKRNAVAHHLWMGHNGIVHRSNVTSKGKLKVVLATVPIQELVEVSELISRGRLELQKFCIERLIPAMDRSKP
jgi:hypothetical protein